MHGRRVDLSDLLTASGSAMAVTNRRLELAGAPALLREFALEIDLEAALKLPGDASTLLFARVARPNAQMTALMQGKRANVRIAARYIAAPSLKPFCEPGAGDGGP